MGDPAGDAAVLDARPRTSTNTAGRLTSFEGIAAKPAGPPSSSPTTSVESQDHVIHVDFDHDQRGRPEQERHTHARTRKDRRDGRCPLRPPAGSLGCRRCHPGAPDPQEPPWMRSTTGRRGPARFRFLFLDRLSFEVSVETSVRIPTFFKLHLLHGAFASASGTATKMAHPRAPLGRPRRPPHRQRPPSTLAGAGCAESRPVAPRERRRSGKVHDGHLGLAGAASSGACTRRYRSTSAQH